MGTSWIYHIQENLCDEDLDEFEPGVEATGSEEWYQTCRRVIEGMFTYPERNTCIRLGLEWNDYKSTANS